MRIIHVLATFDVAGAEQVALRLALQQKADGHDVMVWALGPGPLSQRLTDAAIAHRVVGKRPGVDPLLLAKLARGFRRHAPDVVHSHNPQALLYTAPAAKLARVAMVHTKHGEQPTTPRRLTLRRAAARFVDEFVSVSTTTERHARQEREARPHTMSVIDNGIDTAAFAPDDSARHELRSELGVSSGTVLVGTVGRLAPVKNHALLLEAISPLLGAGCNLALVGDGPERNKLETEVNSRGHGEHVHFLGLRDDVDRVLCGLDVFVMSSDTEGLPLVLLEAMATGLPIVSTRVGGIANVASEGPGDTASAVLVPPKNAMALRTALAEMVDNAPRRQRLGRAGRKIVVDRYALAAVHEKYMAVYQRAVGSG